MSFVVMVALLFCSETLGSYSVFEEEDNITHDLVEADFDINDWTAMNDMFSDDYFYYGDWKEAVNLTVDSVFNSSYSCNLTVSCSTNYFDIISIFKCDSKTCYQEGGEQTEGRWWPTAFLHVYLSDGSIICNHSNTVNWTKDMIEIDRFCPQNAGSESFSDGVSFCMVKTVVFSVGLIIMFFAVISVHLIEKLQTQN
ncbi:uncharacterized protein LOC121814216 isoform X2 [Haplochromis burtoni]|uniref:uncharacterized protein LOC121814216 isoform X2 n=1 Tax=Haplochromis burtoni TaxID=8153 RepID=UPI001C2DC4BA|nr:uncharacterized protein LOC121814216 isoform X2 [Haplochromis burtoni]